MSLSRRNVGTTLRGTPNHSRFTECSKRFQGEDFREAQHGQKCADLKCDKASTQILAKMVSDNNRFSTKSHYQYKVTNLLTSPASATYSRLCRTLGKPNCANMLRNQPFSCKPDTPEQHQWRIGSLLPRQFSICPPNIVIFDLFCQSLQCSVY